MRSGLIYCLLFTVMIPVSCKENKPPAAGSGLTVTDAHDSANRNYADIKYLAKVYSSVVTENTLNRIAIRRSEDPKIMNLATGLLASYDSLGKKIEMIASGKNIQLDPKLRFDQKNHISYLENEAQAVFDREYLNVLIREHKKFLEDFQLTGTNSRDSAVSAMAAEVLKAVSANYARIMIVQAEMRRTN